MTAAGVACATCGTELRQNAKFCDECGAAVSVDAEPAEYKQVTVLFADVVHSMDIAAAVGAERLREMMTTLVDRAAHVVQRYGGTADKFTGDGIMALFGAPTALEDHAFRACLSALAIQREAKALADDVKRRDGIELQLRIGLNSGEVIAGQLGSTPFGYTAVGEQVGMAQRMESVAPPGGVMLSQSTARLVEDATSLGEPESLLIKGSDQPVRCRRLLAVVTQPKAVARQEPTLVGRSWEIAAVARLLDEAMDGHGGVVTFAGPAGIGKTRLVRETAAAAAARRMPVFGTFGQSHTSDVPYEVMARLLCARLRIDDLDAARARARVRDQLSRADPEDLLLLDDLVGIRDPDVALPDIAPDARYRRLTALTRAALLVRRGPALYVIEDVHWIDEASESMLAELLAVIPQTHALVVITYRPGYRGALSRTPGAQAIALAPLNDSAITALITDLLGSDPSVRKLAATVRERACGNPFFAEEIVRDLAERGVLGGNRGAHVARIDVADVRVPATLQAAIAARIDRLDARAKSTLNAAAVIGSRFEFDLLGALGIDPVIDELITAELIEQVDFAAGGEYAFRHPLIRTVAYESQLKSDRTRLHEKLASAIQAGGSEDEHAALIAEHVQAAGDLPTAFGWHMRAGGWSASRDIAAARLSWERARQIADALPADDPARPAMCIAARTLLCGSAWRVNASVSGRFDELKQLCSIAGDRMSLAIGMSGLLGEYMMRGRVRKASQVASEQMALIESIGDPTLIVGLSTIAMAVKHEAGELSDVLRWAQTVIDLAHGDPTMGNLFMGSPLAWALTQRGFARWWLGQRGWHKDFDEALAMASDTDPVTHAYVVNIKHTPGITCGVLRPDDAVLEAITDALRIAERMADDLALGMARQALGVALVHRSSEERARGVEALTQVHDMGDHDQVFPSTVWFADVYVARERARQGDHEGALAVMRGALDAMFNAGLLGAFIPATAVLVETLLARGTAADVADAESAITRLATVPFEDGLVMREIWLVRLWALLARARGDEVRYRDCRDRYREMANSLGFEGHMAWAEAMT
jgi:adenylate cyclase